MNFQGVLIGLMAFVIIGVFHPIVIKAEYYFGTRVWPAFLVAGLAVLGLSLLLDNIIGSAALGVLGFALLWSILELFEQAERVEKGWFPRNPRRETRSPES